MINTRHLAICAVAATTVFAGCANAQPYGPPPPPPGAYGPGGWDISQRIHWIQERIVHGRDDGSLSYREFARVQSELDGIKTEDRDDRYRNGGSLDGPTRHNLEDRLNQLNERIQWLHAHNEPHPW